MITSQNGWPALKSDSTQIHRWTIPAKNGVIYLNLRQGAAGFLLAFLALWFSETIEGLKGKVADDWGYAWRPIRGQTSGLSNHASATAEDFNSMQHPLGVVKSYEPWQYIKIHNFLHKRMKGAIRWGADYNGRKDEMHFEIVQSLAYCERLAKFLMTYTIRGRRLLKANPGQKLIILS